MELDEQEASGSSNEVETPVLNLHDDTEPLPAVIIGSEPWHSQVPAVIILLNIGELIFYMCFFNRIGYQSLHEIHRDNVGKTSSSHLVMPTCQVCPAKDVRL